MTSHLDFSCCKEGYTLVFPAGAADHIASCGGVVHVARAEAGCVFGSCTAIYAPLPIYADAVV